MPPLAPKNPLHHGHNQRDDIHLRSTKTVTGYQIQATDGPIGSVSSFMVDGRSWEIRELVVETGRWYAGKKIFVLPGNINRISLRGFHRVREPHQKDIQQDSTNDVAQVVSVINKAHRCFRLPVRDASVSGESVLLGFSTIWIRPATDI